MAPSTIYYPRCHAVLGVILDGMSGDDSDPFIVETVPSSCMVELNGYKEADTWDLQFDARLLPFDPDIIRAMAVKIYMFADTGLGEIKNWARPEFEVMNGLADSVDLAMSDSGQVFSCDGRDYTALLLDTEWDPKKRFPTGKPLDTAIQEVIDDRIPAPFGRSLEVLWDGEGLPPIVGGGMRSSKKKGAHVKPKRNLWDVFYDMCIRHGLICYVEGETVIVTEPSVQTAKSLADAPKVAYGTNLRELESSRRLGKERVPQVVVTSRDPKAQKPITVQYPKNHKAPTTAIGTKRDERLRVLAPQGVTDRATLERFARTYYENLARSETTYSFRTKHLTGLNDRSLLELRAGKPVQIEWDSFNRETMRQLSGPERVSHLVKLGYSTKVAIFIAEHFAILDRYQRSHYTKTARFDFSSDGGLDVEVEAVNYAYVPREEVD